MGAYIDFLSIQGIENIKIFLYIGDERFRNKEANETDFRIVFIQLFLKDKKKIILTLRLHIIQL